MKNNLLPTDILLPKKHFEAWSCIACDQYTSEPEYWQETLACAKDFPSALKIILPEVNLKDDNSKEIAEINATMLKYLDNDVFNVIENSVIFTKRVLKNGAVRNGLVGLIDLEDYSYEKGAKTAIRATEATVIERIPPRVKIRKDAAIEIPHIMLLIDDPEKTVIEPIADSTNNMEKLYDFTLMQNAGSISGYKLTDSMLANANNALNSLKENSIDGLLYAVGDGNHSLATAKECYKQGTGSRYALVEIVNIHDKSLEFEPIYRILFGVQPEKVIADFVDWCGGDYIGTDAQKFTCVFGEKEKEISVKSHGTLCVATLQTFLDEYLKDKNATLDYIHGIESTKNLARRDNALGFIFTGMEKADLFPAVSKDGSLPRKTFSMGCADDKRFYLEARKIK